MNYMFIMYFCAVFLSLVHEAFGLGIEQCSTRRQNLVPDLHDTCQKPAPEKWSVFHGYHLTAGFISITKSCERLRSALFQP